MSFSLHLDLLVEATRLPSPPLLAGPAVQGCRPNSSWGDNVGTAAPCDTARLEREWMASPGHRRNILDGAYTRIGVGAWTDEKGGCWVQVLFSS